MKTSLIFFLSYDENIEEKVEFGNTNAIPFMKLTESQHYVQMRKKVDPRLGGNSNAVTVTSLSLNTFSTRSAYSSLGVSFFNIHNAPSLVCTRKNISVK